MISGTFILNKCFKISPTHEIMHIKNINIYELKQRGRKMCKNTANMSDMRSTQWSRSVRGQSSGQGHITSDLKATVKSDDNAKSRTASVNSADNLALFVRHQKQHCTKRSTKMGYQFAIIHTLETISPL